jgi:hypothetical protein
MVEPEVKPILSAIPRAERNPSQATKTNMLPRWSRLQSRSSSFFFFILWYYILPTLNDNP